MIRPATRRALLAVVAAVLVLLPVLGLAGPGTPSYAEDGAQISHFEQTPGGVSMLVAVPADATRAPVALP